MTQLNVSCFVISVKEGMVVKLISTSHDQIRTIKPMHKRKFNNNMKIAAIYATARWYYGEFARPFP